MRILFATPYVPSRIRVRSFNLIKSLSTKHEISLVSLVVEDYERALCEEIEQYCVSVDLIPLPKWQAYASCLRALPTSMPLRVAYYRSPSFVRRIKEVIDRQNIDVVHGELVKVAPALRAVVADRNIPILYDSVDCISWFLQQKFEAASNPLKKIFSYTELQKMRRFEQRALVAFDQVIITTPFDGNKLATLTGQAARIEVVSNGVDCDYFAPLEGSRLPDTLVFCAKLDYSPNAQAVLHFCQRVLPLIWKDRPQTKLTIVGNNPPPSVRALAVDERIVVTGYVPDIRPYLGTATVVIAPLLVAAGIQNKLLEALAMGMPTVTSPRCADVLGAQDGVHLLVAEEPQTYARAIVRLLDDPLLAQQLGNAGRQFVTTYYSWERATTTLHRLYDALVRASRQQHLAESMVPLASGASSVS